MDQLSRLWLYPWAVYEQQAQSGVQNLDCRPKKNKKTVKVKERTKEKLKQI
jgi:hypothetical protein